MDGRKNGKNEKKGFFCRSGLVFPEKAGILPENQGVVLEWLRERFAKPCRVGSIPTHASIFCLDSGFFHLPFRIPVKVLHFHPKVRLDLFPIRCYIPVPAARLVDGLTGLR